MEAMSELLYFVAEVLLRTARFFAEFGEYLCKIAEKLERHRL